MSDIEQSSKATLVQDYNGVAKKYAHERETSDALLELAIGSSGWRTCNRQIDDGDRLKPFSPTRYRTLVAGVDPLLFDYSRMAAATCDRWLEATNASASAPPAITTHVARNTGRIPKCPPTNPPASGPTTIPTY